MLAKGCCAAVESYVKAGLSIGLAALNRSETLGPSHPDPGYAKTRLFYEAMGFAPLEETHDLRPGNPCLIMIKVLG